MSTPSTTVRPRGTLPHWYEWLAGVVVLLLAFGYFVVRPAAERLAQGVGGLASVLATHLAETLAQTHTVACRAIEQDPYVQLLLDGPVRCAAVEDIVWQPPEDSETLTFELAVAGDSGLQGTAHVVVRLNIDGPQLESIVVHADRGSVLVLPLPQPGERLP